MVTKLRAVHRVRALCLSVRFVRRVCASGSEVGRFSAALIGSRFCAFSWFCLTSTSVAECGPATELTVATGTVTELTMAAAGQQPKQSRASLATKLNGWNRWQREQKQQPKQNHAFDLELSKSNVNKCVGERSILNLLRLIRNRLTIVKVAASNVKQRSRERSSR